MSMKNTHALGTRILGAVLALALATFASASQAGDKRELYAVGFAVTLDSSGTVKAIRVSEVTNPLSGSARPVKIELPKTYIAAATARINKEHYKPEIENGKIKDVFVYFFYDPATPRRVLVKP